MQDSLGEERERGRKMRERRRELEEREKDNREIVKTIKYLYYLAIFYNKKNQPKRIT